jgi:ribonucleoside-diphosphate reductase alpha chain
MRVSNAAFLGTLQAGYTDFHYLRDIWKETTEKDALIGVSMTGIASNAVKGLDLQKAAELVKATNKTYSEQIGINKAARTTCIKPAGTTSLVLGTSSGIHAWHDKHYIRRVRVGKNEAIYKYLVDNHPELIEDDHFKPHLEAVISIPQRAPDGATLRTEPAISLLERVKWFTEQWVLTGHNDGMNTHNVSATVSIREDEWKDVGEWMWNNRKFYNGLSVLPYDGGTYIQAPFESTNVLKYREMMESLTSVDLTQVYESEDNTDLSGEIACAGGSCEI